MVLITSMVDFYFDRSMNGRGFLYRAIYFLVAGFVVGLVGWWGNESRYKNAKIDARINSNGPQ